MTLDSKAKNRIKEIGLILFSFALGIGLLIYTFRGVDLSSVIDYLLTANIFYLIFFIFIIYVGVFFRALRWKYILESKKPNIKLINLFNAVIIGYGTNVVVPRFGEIFRAIVLAKMEGMSRGAAIGTIFIERVIDLFFLLIVVFISLFVLPEKLIEVYPWLYSSIYIAIIGLVLLLSFFILLIKFQKKLSSWIKILTDKLNIKFLSNISSYVDKVIDGFSTIKSKRSYGLIILHSTLMWMSYAFGSYIALFIFGMNNTIEVNYFTGIIILSITTLGVMVPTPAGTGSYHAFCKSVLTMIYGFNVQVSLAYAVLTHLLNSVPFLIITIIFYLVYQKRKINLLKDNEI